MSLPALAIADVLSECIGALQQSWSLTSFPVVVVATTDRAEETPPRIMACFKHELNCDVSYYHFSQRDLLMARSQAPEESERHSILQSLTRSMALAPDVSLKDFAVQTAALVASDLVDLVARGKHAHLKRAMQYR